MTRLILTSWLILEFTKSDFADLAVDFFFRFVLGPLPPLDELATTYLGARTPAHGPGHHWSDFAARWGQSKNKSCRDLGLVEFCQQYETPSATLFWYGPKICRHNLIHRWWGGTELTNERLWRWDPRYRPLVGP
jgi:hypothetical protein